MSKRTRYILLSLLLLFSIQCAHSGTQNSEPAARRSALQAPVMQLGSEDFHTLSPEEMQSFEISEGGPFTHAFFGYIDPDDPNSNFQVSDHVPLKMGVYYGWALKVRDGLPEALTLKESLKLPSPARIFRINTERSEVSEDGAQVSSTLTLHSEKGWLFNFWQLTPGDPHGDYQLTLTHESQPVITFDFKVVR